MNQSLLSLMATRIKGDFLRRNTLLSRGVRSLFRPTRKSSPWGNFSTVNWINQSSVDFHCKPLVDWLIDDKLTLTWLAYWIRTARSAFTGAGLKWPNTAGRYSSRLFFARIFCQGFIVNQMVRGKILPCSIGVNWKSGKYLRSFSLLAVFLNCPSDFDVSYWSVNRHTSNT